MQCPALLNGPRAPAPSTSSDVSLSAPRSAPQLDQVIQLSRAVQSGPSALPPAALPWDAPVRRLHLDLDRAGANVHRLSRTFKLINRDTFFTTELLSCVRCACAPSSISTLPRLMTDKPITTSPCMQATRQSHQRLPAPCGRPLPPRRGGPPGPSGRGHRPKRRAAHLGPPGGV